jgi:hypothetical protein
MRTSQLQIRVTPEEKAAIEQAARRAGLRMSAYVLRKALPDRARQWSEQLRDILGADGSRTALANFSNWLAGLSAGELRTALDAALPDGLRAETANTIAAMVEHVCALHGTPAPQWTQAVLPLGKPHFASGLSSLRLYLLTNSPAAFRRRNLFVDTAVGGQV